MLDKLGKIDDFFNKYKRVQLILMGIILIGFLFSGLFSMSYADKNSVLSSILLKCSYLCFILDMILGSLGHFKKMHSTGVWTIASAVFVLSTISLGVFIIFSFSNTSYDSVLKDYYFSYSLYTMIYVSTLTW